MIAALRLLYAILGVAALAICLSIVSLGPAATAGFSEALFDALTSAPHPGSGAWPATMDSELRFYAPFWGTYGLVLLHIARRLPATLGWIPPTAAVFFVGGIGRAISWYAVGTPHPFFLLLMAVELVLPVIFVALWWTTTKAAT
jgi:uncharacterized protein DUF4345